MMRLKGKLPLLENQCRAMMLPGTSQMLEMKSRPSHQSRLGLADQYSIGTRTEAHWSETSWEKNKVKNDMSANLGGIPAYWDKGLQMKASDWERVWEERKAVFEMPKVHSKLIAYYDQLVDSKGSDARFFLPLCGKSRDMKWLADKGHDVVGVEYAKLPCREFFEEQRLESDTTPMEDVSGGFLHKSSDGKIKIFQCDFFKFKKSHAGNFDVIWDRASLVALNKSDRKKYVDTITPLLKPDCLYLLEVFVYDGSFIGPPHSIPIDEVKELYGNFFNVTVLEENDAKNAEWVNEIETEMTTSAATLLLQPK